MVHSKISDLCSGMLGMHLYTKRPEYFEAKKVDFCLRILYKKVHAPQFGGIQYGLQYVFLLLLVVSGNNFCLSSFQQFYFNSLQMSERKAVVKNADMPEDMQQDAIECATQAMEKFNIEKDIAAYIKKEFDKKYNPTWHCIVGRNFGSYVTHETKHFIYFYMGQVAILLFKSG